MSTELTLTLEPTTLLPEQVAKGEGNEEGNMEGQELTFGMAGEVSTGEGCAAVVGDVRAAFIECISRVLMSEQLRLLKINKINKDSKWNRIVQKGAVISQENLAELFKELLDHKQWIKSSLYFQHTAVPVTWSLVYVLSLIITGKGDFGMMMILPSTIVQLLLLSCSISMLIKRRKLNKILKVLETGEKEAELFLASRDPDDIERKVAVILQVIDVEFPKVIASNKKILQGKIARCERLLENSVLSKERDSLKFEQAYRENKLKALESLFVSTKEQGRRIKDLLLTQTDLVNVGETALSPEGQLEGEIDTFSNLLNELSDTIDSLTEGDDQQLLEE